MKKIFITLTLTAFFAVIGFSQVVVKPAIGMNFTSFTTDPLTYEHTGRLGYQLGGTVAIGDEFYFEPGVYWVRNNYQLKNKNATLDADEKFKNDISSIKIPLYVGMNIVGGATDDRNFHIFAGPDISYVTSVNNDDVNLTKEDFTKYMWGVNIGAGLSINKLFVDVGYQWGLNTIFVDDDKTKIKGLWINAGFRLKFL